MKGTLQEHMDVIAHDIGQLAYATRVDRGIIQRALNGLPIPEAEAKKLQTYLGTRFGHSHSRDEPPYTVDGLKTV